MKKNTQSLKKRLVTFSRILKYIERFRFLFILSIVLTVAAVALTLYVPILVGEAIDLAIDKNNVLHGEINAILIKILIAILITALFQWIINVINNNITYRMVKRIRHEAFVKIQKFPVSYIDSHQTGDIVSRVINDTDQFSDGLLMGLTQFFTGVFTIAGTLLFMILLSPPIALIVVILTPASLFVAAFIAKRTFSMFKLQSQIKGEQTSLIDESITQHKTVVAFAQEEKIVSRFNEINTRLSKASLKAIFFSSITNPSTRFVNSIIYAAVALIGALSFTGFMGIVISVGELTIFLSYANQYTKPFNEISGVVTELQNALACADRVFELIDEPSVVAEAADPVDAPEQIEAVEFQNVCFSYTKEQKLIENFNLSVSNGQRVAIVGPTGCGKTTLINLLMRYYDVSSGTIRINGNDIRDIKRSDLREVFGMVLQDTWIAPGTIKSNIGFGKPDVSDGEIIAAAKAAHAHSFIKKLPDGYNTVIDENGSSLSQGQKQLLCIARVMLTLPQILILDEATSSIDTRTEMKIQNAFATMMKGRTSFIVAHRLSTIKEADIILVMKDGNVIEKGTHKELLASGGFYSELFNSQFPKK
jgi:ATP-binding cassette subfamily B protein